MEVRVESWKFSAQKYFFWKLKIDRNRRKLKKISVSFNFHKIFSACVPSDITPDRYGKNLKKMNLRKLKIREIRVFFIVLFFLSFLRMRSYQNKIFEKKWKIFFKKHCFKIKLMVLIKPIKKTAGKFGFTNFKKD